MHLCKKFKRESKVKSSSFAAGAQNKRSRVGDPEINLGHFAHFAENNTRARIIDTVRIFIVEKRKNFNVA